MSHILPTQASETVHLVASFTDSLDALPPSLTRSLSDLKELDAVLSGSLSNITEKLKVLMEMMHSPPLTADDVSKGKQPKYTPLQRLKLLREVTEDARIFRLGGEDKIRVATATCDTISTHTSHLAQLAQLLMDYLPPTLLPQLPPPSAPHGYPASITPSTALARRQQFDYPSGGALHTSSTSRMHTALGMVREHWDLTRGRDRERPSSTKKRDDKIKDAHPGLMGDKDRAGKDSNGLARHPNQYTKKKVGGAPGHTGLAGSSMTNSMQSHPMGMTAVDSVREKRKAETGAGGNGGGAGTSSRGTTSGTTGLYPGMATAEEYAAATAGGARAQKRKVEDTVAASKRRKKGPDVSPDITPRQIPTPPPGNKPPRRTNSARVEEPVVPLPLPVPDEAMDTVGDEDEEEDAHTYCICDRISFGEMIGCDGSDCEREWFHLPCVGLSTIPKGRWLCDDCKKRNGDKNKKRR